MRNSLCLLRVHAGQLTTLPVTASATGRFQAIVAAIATEAMNRWRGPKFRIGFFVAILCCWWWWFAARAVLACDFAVDGGFWFSRLLAFQFSSTTIPFLLGKDPRENDCFGVILPCGIHSN
jgi:hypothetical protein